MDSGIQRPAYEIHPPAVARHLAFRLKMRENPRWKTKRYQRDRQWEALCAHLAAHINRLRGEYENDREVKILPPHRPSDIERDRYSTRASCIIPINQDETADGYRLRVRVDVHTELFSLTYILDRAGAKGPLLERLAQLHTDRPGASPASDWLLDDVWEDQAVPLARELDSWLPGPNASPADRKKRRRIGQLITDFRGIIICPELKWSMDKPAFEQEDAPGPRSRGLDGKLKAFAKARESLIRAIADPDAPAAERQGSRKIDPSRAGEAVVCGMLGGKALYAAALGGSSTDVAALQPIRHLLVYAGRSCSQLGRLVRRMHVLGELRHAALIDFDPEPASETPSIRRSGASKGALRDVSREMRALGRELSDETPKITGQTDHLAHDADGPPDPQWPMRRLQYFVSELAAISQRVDGGLTYRVEQSRYYAKEFRDSIGHLRLVRVGEWQRYDDFVRRHILHLFARIDRIGNRYEAVGRRVDRLLFFKQAQLLDTYTKGVSGMLNGIRKATKTLNDSADRQIKMLEKINQSTGLLNKSANRQIEASKKQIELLKGAEYFALVFLIYYVGSVFKYAIEEQAMHGIDKKGFLTIWAQLIGVGGGLLALVIVARIIFPWLPRPVRRRSRTIYIRFLRWRRNRSKLRARPRPASKPAASTPAGSGGAV